MSSTLKFLTGKASKSMRQAEKLWLEAKDAATDKGLSPESDEYWASVVGVVKTTLGVESADLLRMGYGAKVISEAIIPKSSANFMKSRMRKVTDEISKIDSENDPNWKSLALNLRLFFNEYLGALSSRTGLKALLLGEGAINSAPSVLRRIREVDSVAELLSIYTEAFPGVDVLDIEEALYA